MDGEAIVINAVTGRYYSLDDAACVAWVHLAAGSRLTDVVAAIVERYDVDPEVARADVVALADQLLAEDLLVVSTDGAPADPVDESQLPPNGGGLRPYGAPEVVTFRDMEDLLAFDPPLPVVEPHEWEWRAD
jgi:hypothetical protein